MSDEELIQEASEVLGQDQNDIPQVDYYGAKDLWGDIFCHAVYMVLGDQEILETAARNPMAATLWAKGARNIADAAMDEYESRWPSWEEED